ncbi:hypothetical protein CAOG_01812 [Capsaspora owczarzaki ATCC 30864]|uniref:Uncharacterized protein n=1 Tax=Capsaspora owczarzaki (strain ATCC 30864) TaxID=595528 RepID=A0A0D2VKF9_CAPO3|nr:hypothetical protein CAOG_01812 [Capsaspora owczarzaki ATCC 30864]KJE90502.1 hypothetical protein CAOG_001812 [Capsaspora owczarzaki ATCC 30864]|eukprot:XP_004364680.1 hypothetical protein CAOG_01812 [Capsaspora owczarzaki ATCC 30864]
MQDPFEGPQEHAWLSDCARAELFAPSFLARLNACEMAFEDRQLYLSGPLRAFAEFSLAVIEHIICFVSSASKPLDIDNPQVFTASPSPGGTMPSVQLIRDLRRDLLFTVRTYVRIRARRHIAALLRLLAAFLADPFSTTERPPPFNQLKPDFIDKLHQRTLRDIFLFHEVQCDFRTDPSLELGRLSLEADLRQVAFFWSFDRIHQHIWVGGALTREDFDQFAAERFPQFREILTYKQSKPFNFECGCGEANRRSCS